MIESQHSIVGNQTGADAADSAAGADLNRAAIDGGAAGVAVIVGNSQHAGTALAQRGPPDNAGSALQRVVLSRVVEGDRCRLQVTAANSNGRRAGSRIIEDHCIVEGKISGGSIGTQLPGRRRGDRGGAGGEPDAASRSGPYQMVKAVVQVHEARIVLEFK